MERSPDIDTRRPVSRQHEAGVLQEYYGYPYYWGGGRVVGHGSVSGQSDNVAPRIEEELKAHQTLSTPTSDSR